MSHQAPLKILLTLQSMYSLYKTQYVVYIAKMYLADWIKNLQYLGRDQSSQGQSLPAPGWRCRLLRCATPGILAAKTGPLRRNPGPGRKQAGPVELDQYAPTSAPAVEGWQLPMAVDRYPHK